MIRNYGYPIPVIRLENESLMCLYALETINEVMELNDGNIPD